MYPIDSEKHKLAYYVLRDTAEEYPLGSALTDKATVDRVRNRGGDLLPFTPRYAVNSGMGAVIYRPWGQGVSVPSPAIRTFAPMAMFLGAGVSRLIWKVRLGLTKQAKEHFSKGDVNGSIRLAFDSTQAGGASAPGLAQAPVDLGKLEPNDQHEWTVGGQVGVTPLQAGFYGLCLYGFANVPGVQVLWSAVTQAEGNG
jgi:hypothetical protein